MIKYYVRTTGERTLDESFSQIDYELLVDTEHDSGKAFMKQLEIINENDCVVMEDDIILCKDFKNRIEEVIKQYPNKVINFFTNPLEYTQTRETTFFCYNQCTYYPKGIGRTIINVVNRHGIPTKRQEIIIRDSLRILKQSHIVYRPCLVQHIDAGSLMNHHPVFCRRSPYFIDYLDELDITYKEAGTYANRTKLINLMKEKFKNNN